MTLWSAAHQASLIISLHFLKLISVLSVMPSNHLILCCPLLLLPSIFSSIRVLSNESVLHIWWPNYWSFSFSISPSNEYSGCSVLTLYLMLNSSLLQVFYLNIALYTSLIVSPVFQFLKANKLITEWMNETILTFLPILYKFLIYDT